MKHLIFKRADTTETLGQNVFHLQNTSHTSVFPLHLSHRPPLSGSPRPHRVSAGLWGREPPLADTLCTLGTWRSAFSEHWLMGEPSLGLWCGQEKGSCP